MGALREINAHGYSNSEERQQTSTDCRIVNLRGRPTGAFWLFDSFFLLPQLHMHARNRSMDRFAPLLSFFVFASFRFYSTSYSPSISLFLIHPVDGRKEER
mmetsp:Transcript_18888/g.38147  ORF Transcript_18888/g.38147 Transcript_18888/m.38147 type:complete len:101 (-) Transcript_18888:1704-2006(-)